MDYVNKGYSLSLCVCLFRWSPLSSLSRCYSPKDLVIVMPG